MILRGTVLAGLVCGLALGEAGPWDRFFHQPPVSASEGISRASSRAFNSPSLFQSFEGKKKLKKDEAVPVFPTLPPNLSVLPNTKLNFSNDFACAIPLDEVKPTKNMRFFIGSIPAPPNADSKMAQPAPIPPCRAPR